METNVTEPTALRCESCGRIRKRLFSAPHTVKSLSLGHEVREGDMICERCLMELQEELTDEEMSRGPARSGSGPDEME